MPLILLLSLQIYSVINCSSFLQQFFFNSAATHQARHSHYSLAVTMFLTRSTKRLSRRK